MAWYQRAGRRSDYAERVLEAIGLALSRCVDALDVGAGFGALALPLARRLGAVTALEPAPAMARALRAAAAAAGLGIGCWESASFPDTQPGDWIRVVTQVRVAQPVSLVLIATGAAGLLAHASLRVRRRT